MLRHLLEAAKGGHELASSPFVLGLHQEVKSLPQGLTSIFKASVVFLLGALAYHHVLNVLKLPNLHAVLRNITFTSRVQLHARSKGGEGPFCRTICSY